MATHATSKRQYNLDLLRMASMFLIVLLHSNDQSGVLAFVANQDTTLSSLYVHFVYALTQVSVNCFVIISGYFLVRSHFKLSKLVALWIETVFYSLLFKILFAVFGSDPLSIASLLSCFVPIFTGRYWFITIYFGMYLLSPFLNGFIRVLGCKKHALLNIVLFLIMSVWVSFHPSIVGMNSGGGWGLAWFVVLYLLGAWFSLYYRPNYKWLPKLILWIFIPIFMTVSLFLAKLSGIGLAVSVVQNWFRYDSVPVCLATIFFVALFLNLRGPQSKVLCKVIGFVSPLTFGVYLIHAHANVIPWLWEHSMLASHTQEPYFPLMQFGLVAGIFVACILMDAVRNFIFRPLERSKKLQSFCNKVTESFVKICSHLSLHFADSSNEAQRK